MSMLSKYGSRSPRQVLFVVAFWYTILGPYHFALEIVSIPFASRVLYGRRIFG